MDDGSETTSILTKLLIDGLVEDEPLTEDSLFLVMQVEDQIENVHVKDLVQL